MENNLKTICERLNELKDELIHGGYTGEMLENHIADTLSNELLHELSLIENKNSCEIKKALVNMFFAGQLSKLMI